MSAAPPDDGGVQVLPVDPPDGEAIFEEELERSRRFERSLLWRELLAISIVVAVVVVRQLWLG